MHDHTSTPYDEQCVLVLAEVHLVGAGAIDSEIRNAHAGTDLGETPLTGGDGKS